MAPITPFESPPPGSAVEAPPLVEGEMEVPVEDGAVALFKIDQKPIHVSAQLVVDDRMELALTPIVVGAVVVGVLGPGVCARNQTPWPVCQLTPINAACKNARPREC